jgi:hypothetical protein
MRERENFESTKESSKLLSCGARRSASCRFVSKDWRRISVVSLRNGNIGSFQPPSPPHFILFFLKKKKKLRDVFFFFFYVNIVRMYT